MSAYEKFLAEIRTIQASLDRLGDLLTLIAPQGAGNPGPEWSCGHHHATRGEAVDCLREMQRYQPPPAG